MEGGEKMEEVVPSTPATGKLTAQQVAENFGMSECDDFMAALKDVMGEDDE